ncbi:unnamed protein product [Effrenium voratum]|nr:unnamed protein product [Effrenium voratum]
MALWTFTLLATALAQTEEFACTLPASYSQASLKKLISLNCDKVSTTVNDFTALESDQSDLDRGLVMLLGDDYSLENVQWQEKGTKAMDYCEDAKRLLARAEAEAWSSPENETLEKMRNASLLAVNAWGTVMLQGRKCCTLPRAPYCIDQSWSASTVALLVPVAGLAILFTVSVISSWILPQPSKEPEQMTERDETLSRPGSRTPRVSCRSALKKELEMEWLQKNCLRVLPGASDFANTTSSIFGALKESFDFQADSVRNQYEHFLSLWRSQVAMVADRSVGQGASVNERELLYEAAGDLYFEMMDGFLRWRNELSAVEANSVPELKEDEQRPVGGAKFEPLKREGVDPASAAILSRQLTEMATYLLVWGEAGNVRFMPEAVYFITELALAANPADFEEVYGSAIPEPSLPGAPFRSNLFLSKVIRPIYNVVFDEWYQYVDIDANNQKDKKKLKPGLENFLPPDVANYDDWNEFFCDPARMMEGILLQDGTRLFDLPHDRRFLALPRVDWQVTLEAAETKTHREIHSLWGVFASTHRIVLLHLVLFFAGVCTVTGDPDPNYGVPIMGQSTAVRFSAVALVVPVHALLWAMARWQVTGRVLRLQQPLTCVTRSIWKTLWWMLPVLTYAGIRDACLEDSQFGLPLTPLLVFHFALSGTGLFYLLFVPSGSCIRSCGSNSDKMWEMSQVPLMNRLVRYGFWFVLIAVKFMLGLIIFGTMFEATQSLQIALPGRESVSEISEIYYSTEWGSDFLLWFVLWFTTLVLFISDTQLWFTVLCSILGVSTVLVQRGCRVFAWALEDSVAKLPERFSRKVLPYSFAGSESRVGEQVAQFSPYFPAIWDRILEYMRYEDKIDNHLMGDLSFKSGESGHQVYWKQLRQPVGRRRQPVVPDGMGSAALGEREMPGGTYAATTTLEKMGKPRRKIKVPDIFREKTAFEAGFKTYCCMNDGHWPNNADVQWRLLALSRGLGLPMPRPFRAPYFPGLTVCIPHYGESILMQKKELFQGREETVPLMDWLAAKYEEEFLTFSNRMQVKWGDSGWPVQGSQWEEYTDQQWSTISAWASMRMQTLWRTVAGMCLYHPAIQCHWEVQADKKSSLAQPGIWNPSDCFTCLVSMQMYKFFDKTNLEHTNRMFAKFPDCLKVAFIDCEDKGITGELDLVHPKQKRRYYSSLIDGSCEDLPTGLKKAKFRVEQPGYPILGDGKGDNQNHAIPFMRGVFSQCIDANQGAYFEQMMLLPCALGEFRSKKRGDGLSKRIVGFPEHITSDIGSIGDFAASAEVAFGTILQRSYAVLGARMHYGHPDIMNKLYMMQQGGVSKATKTVNLSEDIFAGMDFTLRGNGRNIKHAEYFNLAKGRDLGFNTVLGFFSKLSSGTGEQVLTRQAFRLHQVLHLPEALTFYYAHVGYYFTQLFVSWSMPLLVFVWLLVLLADEVRGGIFEAFLNLEQVQMTSAEVMAKTVGVWFSWLLLLFLIATSLPLLAEIWMERNLKVAVERFLKQMLTMSPLMFIFQAKIIGHYVINEIRYGGATYVSTGRGLPTDRRPFIGEAVPGKRRGQSQRWEPGLGEAAWNIPSGVSRSKGQTGRWLSPPIDIEPDLGSWIRIQGFAPSFEVHRHLSRVAVAAPWPRFQLKKMGGLYLDYASIAYYDGVTLLFGVLLILMAGGVSGAGLYARDVWWVFICLGLTVASWLWAPFLFNPYQFVWKHFVEDFRCLVAFFLEGSGRHWVEWYDRTQLKPRGGGLHKSMVDITFVVAVFFLAAWYAMINMKIDALMLAYSGAVSGNMLHIAVLLPPIGASFLYCVLAVLFETLVGCSSILRRRIKPKRSKALTTALSSAMPAPKDAEPTPTGEADVEEGVRELTGTEEEEEEEEVPHATAQDREVAPAPAAAAMPRGATMPEAGPRWCELGIPLSFSAWTVTVLDLAEAVYAIYVFVAIGWRNASVAGFILKWGLLMMCIFFGEGMLRSRCCNVLGCCGLPLQLWVRAHRMSRDIMVSSLIFSVMVPFVLLNSINDYLCPGCSAHQLLIYRDPGHLARAEAVVVDIGDGDWFEDDRGPFDGAMPHPKPPQAHMH